MGLVEKFSGYPKSYITQFFLLKVPIIQKEKTLNHRDVKKVKNKNICGKMVIDNAKAMQY